MRGDAGARYRVKSCSAVEPEKGSIVFRKELGSRHSGRTMLPSFAGKRVLVVEDNPLLAYDLCDTLGDIGSEPIGPALNLASGFALLRTSELDAALLDIDLGGEPVWPLAEALQQKRVPFAFITADCTVDYVSGLFQSEVCLEKPASRREIVELIGELTSTAGSR